MPPLRAELALQSKEDYGVSGEHIDTFLQHQWQGQRGLIASYPKIKIQEYNKSSHWSKKRCNSQFGHTQKTTNGTFQKLKVLPTKLIFFIRGDGEYIHVLSFARYRAG